MPDTPTARSARQGARPVPIAAARLRAYLDVLSRSNGAAKALPEDSGEAHEDHRSNADASGRTQGRLAQGADRWPAGRHWIAGP
jgi:hypothetical protein